MHDYTLVSYFISFKKYIYSQFFPPFVSRHYSYLRDVYPKLVPQLLFFKQTKNESSEEKDSEKMILDVTESERTTLEYLLNRVTNIKSSDQGLESVLTSLRKLKQMELSDHERQCVQGKCSLTQSEYQKNRLK